MCGLWIRSNASRTSKLGVKYNLFWPKMMENGLVKLEIMMINDDPDVFYLQN